MLSQIQAVTGLVQLGTRAIGGVLSGIGSAFDHATSTHKSRSVDSADLSPGARTLAGLSPKQEAAAALGVKPRADGSVHLEDIDNALAEDLAAFRKDLGELFRSMGIDTVNDLWLQTNANGEVIVNGDHPRTAEIEQAFRDHPDLANRFRKISANASLVHAAREAAAFRDAYAADPAAAVRDYRHLFEDGSSQRTVLHVTQGGIEVARKTAGN